MKLYQPSQLLCSATLGCAPHKMHPSTSAYPQHTNLEVTGKVAPPARCNHPARNQPANHTVTAKVNIRWPYRRIRSIDKQINTIEEGIQAESANIEERATLKVI